MYLDPDLQHIGHKESILHLHRTLEPEWINLRWRVLYYMQVETRLCRFYNFFCVEIVEKVLTWWFRGPVLWARWSPIEQNASGADTTVDVITGLYFCKLILTLIQRYFRFPWLKRLNKYRYTYYRILDHLQQNLPNTDTRGYPRCLCTMRLGSRRAFLMYTRSHRHSGRCRLPRTGIDNCQNREWKRTHEYRWVNCWPRKEEPRIEAEFLPHSHQSKDKYCSN